MFLLKGWWNNHRWDRLETKYRNGPGWIKSIKVTYVYGDYLKVIVNGQESEIYSYLSSKKNKNAYPHLCNEEFKILMVRTKLIASKI